MQNTPKHQHSNGTVLPRKLQGVFAYSGGAMPADCCYISKFKQVSFSVCVCQFSQNDSLYFFYHNFESAPCTRQDTAKYAME